jgi:hypothetical protein
VADPVLRVVPQDDLDGLIEYVRRIGDLLSQRDYTWEVGISDLSPGTRATCEVVVGRKYAAISVTRDFFDLPAEDRREAVVHEVLHVHLHPLMNHVNDLQGELARPHYETVERLFRRDLEQTVDALTTACAGYMPLPGAR